MWELTITGQKYTGTFRGECVAREIWYGSSCSQSSIDGRFYEGTGLIKELDSSEPYFFTFSTAPYDRYDWRKPKNLEESLVNVVSKRTRVNKDNVKIEIYKKIVDLALSKIVEEVSSSEFQIPEVRVSELNCELLIECGYLPGENGQLNLLELLK